MVTVTSVLLSGSSEAATVGSPYGSVAVTMTVVSTNGEIFLALLAVQHGTWRQPRSGRSPGQWTYNASLSVLGHACRSISSPGESPKPVTGSPTLVPGGEFSSTSLSLSLARSSAENQGRSCVPDGLRPDSIGRHRHGGLVIAVPVVVGERSPGGTCRRCPQQVCKRHSL